MNKMRITLVAAELLALVLLKVIYELRKKGKLPLGSRVNSLKNKTPVSSSGAYKWYPPPKQTAPNKTG